jgi:hypothetical protein
MWSIVQYHSLLSKIFSPMPSNKYLSQVSDKKFNVWRHGSSQSAQSTDRVMMHLVYMRIPTNMVAAIKDIAAHKTTHFSREYGSSKSGSKPGGGFMLGIFAMGLGWAILLETRDFPNTSRIKGEVE